MMRPDRSQNAPIERQSSRVGRLRCLWIGRYIPYPMNEGAKVYSAKLASSLAGSGMTVRALGYGDPTRAPSSSDIEWLGVPGERRRDIGGLFSRLPLAAAVDSTDAYRSLLETQLREAWDAIVLDGYGAGWALDMCLRYRASRSSPTVLVHVSHNHETMLWRSMASDTTATGPRRWVLKQNAAKVRSLERRLVDAVDVLTTITPEDGAALGGTAASSKILTLPPGYDGETAAARTLAAATPRRVVVVGSFNWIVKRENLRRFVAHADPIFARHGIELVVAGEMPAELRNALQSRCAATSFIGFVPNLLSLLGEARLALVPELIGGGFKLKLLDYIFARVPVATVTAAAAGLPAAVREHLFTADDFAALTAAVVASIDDLDDLNRRQAAAFSAARSSFRWPDRGKALHRVILEHLTSAKAHRLRDAS